MGMGILRTTNYRVWSQLPLPIPKDPPSQMSYHKELGLYRTRIEDGHRIPYDGI